ncbi:MULTISPECIES: methyl-accepting chemotaxis protein [Rheinheimera]|uniref:Methyl-accepting chemotaxis protein n=1 Tax=Rheinheimera marina TaxID=1774958 RepID=A0ABV9JL78_9GAMM
MLRKLKVGKRLALSFGLLVLVSVIVGVVAMFRFAETQASIDNIADRRLPATMLVAEMNREFMLIRLRTVNILLAQTEEERQQEWQQLSVVMKNYDQFSAQASEFHKSAAGKATFDKVLQAKAGYDSMHSKMLTLMRDEHYAEAQAMRGQGVNQASANLTQALADLAQYQKTTAHQQSENAKRSIVMANTSMVTVIVLAIGLGGVLAFFFSRSLTLPMNNAVLVSQRIASGDLTQNFHDDEPDEAGEMIRAMARMQQQLRKTIHDISHSSSQLAATSEELSVVTEQSSRTLNQQSMELDMAVTAVTELTAAIEDVARNALETSRNSTEADEEAKHGKQRVDLAVDSIRVLETDLQQARQGIVQLVERVQSIGSVLDVIRAIADQTNLLALNAAIEAARAGESGRGFAVVADEVRALAHRTQESTKEIEKMMQAVQAETQQTVESIERSSKVATETRQASDAAGTAFSGIAVSLGQINDQNMTVASAAEQQATVAREVDRGLLNIRDLSAQTSEGAHETQASSAELARLAEHLNQLVTQFRV